MKCTCGYEYCSSSSSSGSGSGLLLMDRLSNVLDITIVFSLTPVVCFFWGGVVSILQLLL